MNRDLKATSLQLIEKIKGTLSAEELARTGAVLDALRDGRVWFEREDWYDLTTGHSDTSCGELLFRAKNPDGSPLSVRPLLDIAQTKGLYRLLDPLLVLNQVAQTIRDDKFPVSLNISSRNACDPDALLTLHDMLQDHFGDQVKPSGIVFEFLEDDMANNPSHETITLMRDLGYRFAIDDQSHIAADMVRARNLAPYVDFIKIDGQSVDAARRGIVDLGTFTTQLQTLAPQAAFICEWINSPEEAYDLHTALPNVRFIQGRDLHQTAADFSKELKAGKSYRSSKFLIGPPAPPAM